jgi:hypothetical protein
LFEKEVLYRVGKRKNAVAVVYTYKIHLSVFIYITILYYIIYPQACLSHKTEETLCLCTKETTSQRENVNDASAFSKTKKKYKNIKKNYKTTQCESSFKKIVIKNIITVKILNF